MGITDIPADYDAFEYFNREYEGRNYSFAETNKRIGVATRELFVSWMPLPLAPVVRSVIYALMDDALLEAFGFPHPSRTMRWLVSTTLCLRARLLRYSPPRRRPRLRTEMKRAIYPEGYDLGRIGPTEKMDQSTPR